MVAEFWLDVAAFQAGLVVRRTINILCKLVDKTIVLVVLLEGLLDHFILQRRLLRHGYGLFWTAGPIVRYLFLGPQISNRDKTALIVDNWCLIAWICAQFNLL